MHLNIELQKQQQNGSIQDRVKNPGTDSIAAPVLHKMQQKNSDMAHQIASQKHHLTVYDEGKTGAW